MSAGAILGGGISYAANGVLAALSNITVTALSTAVNALESAVGPWRPPQWSQPPKTSILIPGSNPVNNAAGTGAGYISTNPIAGTGSINEIGASGAVVPLFSGVSTTSQGTPSTLLIFDGVLKLEHTQGATPTEFPVQSGANISDHVFIKPARLVMEIFMSDAMQSYTPGQFTGSNTRSVSAYQALKALLTDRTAVTINTKLDTYPYMILTNMSAPDSFETSQSLHVTCTFQQIFTGQISSTGVSSRTGTTDETQLGNVQTLPVPDVVDDSYYVPPPLPAQSLVPYSGTYSSNFGLGQGDSAPGFGGGTNTFVETGTDVGNTGTPP